MTPGLLQVCSRTVGTSTQVLVVPLDNKNFTFTYITHMPNTLQKKKNSLSTKISYDAIYFYDKFYLNRIYTSTV